MLSKTSYRKHEYGFDAKTDFLVFLVILFIFLWNSFETPRIHYTFGDTQTQMFTMSAFKHFADNGFLAGKLSPRTPSRSMGSSFNRLGDYIHYPPLPYYLNGLPYLTGSTDLKIYKILISFWGFLGIVAAYLFFKKNFGQRFAAFSVLGVFIFVPFWETYVENATRIDVPLLFFGLLAYSHHLESEKPAHRSKFFWISYGLYFLCSYASFEYTMAFGLIAFGLSLYRAPGVFLSRNSFVDLALLASSPVISLLVHLLNNAWYLGGLRLAIADLRYAFLWRTFETVDNPAYNVKFLKRAVGGGTFSGWVWNNINKSYGLLYMGVLLAGIRWVCLFKQKTFSVMQWRCLCALFFAMPSFIYIFRQATVIEWAISHAVHFLFPVSVFFVGVLAPRIELFGHLRFSRAFDLLTKGLLVFCLFSSAKGTVNFLNRRGNTLFSEEVKVLASIKSSLDEKISTPIGRVLLITNDYLTSRAAFVHNPRSFFGITEADVFYAPNAIEFEKILAANAQFYDPDMVFYFSKNPLVKPDFLQADLKNQSLNEPYLLKLSIQRK